MNRRDFLKAGLIGIPSIVIGGAVVSGTKRAHASSRPFAFPAPVHRTLGRTGLKITVVSFGAMLTPEPEVMRLAFDNGVNYVDTARGYMGGANEEIVGRALRGIRDKVFVATKTTSRSREDIFRDAESSLRSLGTDRIDVLQLHSLKDGGRALDPETREALARLREQGKVRFFGVTTHTNQAEVLDAVADDPDGFFDVALVGYNFKSGRRTEDAIAKAAAAGIGIVAMKTQAGGYGKEATGGVTPHQAALKWALRNPNVAASIPGMRDLAELREDIAVMGMPFRAADGRALERYGAAIDPFYCRLCGSCEGACPKKVEISTIHRALMYEEGYRERGLARATYRAIPASASAAACLDCSSCPARCVHGIDIAAKMAKARKLLE